MKTFRPEKALLAMWGSRPRNTHKGQNGRVLVIGGSPEYAGAPILAANAALRGGADLVTLAAPAHVVQAANEYCPDVRGMPLPGLYISGASLKPLLQKSREFDVVLLGNGIGKKGVNTLTRLIPALEKQGTKMVLDATAFDALARLPHFPENSIYLPHLGEFERWTGTSVRKKSLNEREKLLRKMIGEKRLVINLKDWRSVIVSPHYSYHTSTGNPGMSKGGFGDVLAGFTAGFWAQGMGAFSSAACAAWLNGKLSDGLRGKKWYTFVARDILSEITEMKRKKERK